jgi:nucleotide-binding universal stress UspA family protein
MKPAFRNIVAAVDFSDSSLAAAEIAADIARAAQGSLHLLHVVADVLVAPWIVSTSDIGFSGLQQRLENEAARKLTALSATEPFQRMSVVCAVESGSAADAIVEYARRHTGDLIVVGTHGYGPVKRFLLGHVADRVIRQARCPVLTVPHESLGHADQEPLP